MAKGTRRSKGDVTLTKALSTLLAKTLVPDLRERANSSEITSVLRRSYERERQARRTADNFDEWVARTVEQVGAAWVLSCVFVRTLEDRGLLDHRRIAGEGATDSEQMFFEMCPSLTARDYLLALFRELSRLPGAEALFSPTHNPLWKLSPSNDGARALLSFFREEIGGAYKWTFGGGDTRFLGDLYQDLSEDVRERYALLQTPRFVESFILDQTLEPAIKEFGISTVRLIDPTCGSGHFLLGAFERLLEHRQRQTPGIDVREQALAALSQVFGVDLNPFAAAIARFRLTVRFLEKTGIAKLGQAPRLPLNVVVADSLLHGSKGWLAEVAIDKAAWGGSVFELEEPEAARRTFAQRYHVVVGNPPYISCKDDALRGLYRQAYTSAAGMYALAAPFTERFFQIAEDGGFVGMINANSFAKRDFGRPLVEKVLPRFDLTNVIDLQSVSIPGNKTPSVILLGRCRRPVAEHVNVVVYKKGEGDVPGGQGPAWRAIVEHFGTPGFENDFIASMSIARKTLAVWPWSLVAGHATRLKEKIEKIAPERLADLCDSMGRTTHTGEDSAFFWPTGAMSRLRLGSEHHVALVKGEQVRDWVILKDDVSLFPYDRLGEVRSLGAEESKVYWPYRALLRGRQDYGEKIEARGLRWYEHSMFFAERFREPLGLAFPFVSTHNHFVLDRGGSLFKQTAPIIKLKAGATEEYYLGLLGYLNTSTAGFWFRQVLFPKGGDKTADGGRTAGEGWEDRLEFAGTLTEKAPIPARSVLASLVPLARQLDKLGVNRAAQRPEVWLQTFDGDIAALATTVETCRETHEEMTERMVYLQEELDWQVYRLLGLTTCSAGPADGRAKPHWRPFERRMAASGEQTVWFERHGRLPGEIDEIPAPLRRTYREREEAIAKSGELALLERPECKRRWEPEDFETLLAAAATARLLDLAETVIRGSSLPASIRVIATRLERQPVAMALLDVLGRGDAQAVLAELVADEQVPFIASLRFSPEGRKKHRRWLAVWECQRREDRGETVAIESPPKYARDDYSNARFWSLRGKLDVPKERFVSYPGCERDADKSPIIGWAGWDHLERAQAVAALYSDAVRDGWHADRLAPLLAAIAELVPWLKQWRNEPDPAFDGARMGDVYEGFVETEARRHQLAIDHLRQWPPSDEHGVTPVKAPSTIRPVETAGPPKLKKPRKPRTKRVEA